MRLKGGEEDGYVELEITIPRASVTGDVPALTHPSTQVLTANGLVYVKSMMILFNELPYRQSGVRGDAWERQRL